MQFYNSGEFKITCHWNSCTGRNVHLCEVIHRIAWISSVCYSILKKCVVCSLAQGLQQCYIEGEAGGRAVRLPACLPAHGLSQSRALLTLLCHAIVSMHKFSGGWVVWPPSTSLPFYKIVLFICDLLSTPRVTLNSEPCHSSRG
jgi:hypothetical protein